MAGGTVVSRLTGFARTAALAGVLGLSVTADAFNAASSVPTMLLVLVTGGTLSAAVVPLLSEPETPQDRRRTAGSVLVAVAAVAGLGALLMAALAPVLSGLLAASAPDASAAERERQVELFLYLLAPQVLLLGVLVATNGILTAAGRLGRVGATPVLNNVLALAGIGLYAALARNGDGRSTGALALLGASSTVALGVAVATQLASCRDLLPRPRALLHAVDRAVLRRLVGVGRWSVVYVVANQVGLFAVLVAAGRATGAVSAYQWSFAVMQLPYAVAAVPVLSAAVPGLTRARARGERRRFDDLARSSGTLLAALTLPAAAGLLLFGDVAAALLLQRAEGADVAELSAGIRWFGLALVPFVAFQLLTRLAYVVDRPAWPALVNVAVNATTVLGAAAALVVVRPDAVLDLLAAGYALSYVVGSSVLAVLLRRASVPPPIGAGGLPRVVALTTGAVALALAARRLVDDPAGTALAAVAFLTPVALALWPWRRTVLMRPAG